MRALEKSTPFPIENGVRLGVMGSDEVPDP
jgi:hypothetical protein